MKKIFIFAFLSLAFLAVASPAFALQCKVGNYGSDECWTDVRVSPLETTYPVSVGTVLVYDFKAGDIDGVSPNSPDGGAFQVRVLQGGTASLDSYRVAGVAQTVIATGDRGRILVRGRGKVRQATQSASGDRLYVVNDGDMVGALGIRGGTESAPILYGQSSYDKVIAFALKTQSDTNGYTSQDAYITVI